MPFNYVQRPIHIKLLCLGCICVFTVNDNKQHTQTEFLSVNTP